MANVKDIVWLAGLLEGEGCFTKAGSSPAIELCMTDQEIVEKASILLKATESIYRYSSGKPGHSVTYRIRITGNLAVQWMLTLYCLMGNRRKTRISELIDSWKEIGRVVDTKNFCRSGHPREGNMYAELSGKLRCRMCVRKRSWD